MLLYRIASRLNISHYEHLVREEGMTWGLSRLRDALGQKYRVIALELPGFGASPANTRSQSVQELASTVAQASAQVVPEHYTLIGTSFGAHVALWQTLQALDKVEALVLIAPTALLPDFPIFGICLGHQMITHALGGTTFKLKFGHRGGNQPVKDLESGKVEITSQNHGFAVDAKSLPPELVVDRINLNDQTVEGMRHRTKPIFCVQYHPEASPGPHDSTSLFARFRELVKKV